MLCKAVKRWRVVRTIRYTYCSKMLHSQKNRLKTFLAFFRILFFRWGSYYIPFFALFCFMSDIKGIQDRLNTTAAVTVHLHEAKKSVECSFCRQKFYANVASVLPMCSRCSMNYPHASIFENNSTRFSTPSTHSTRLTATNPYSGYSGLEWLTRMAETHL